MFCVERCYHCPAHRANSPAQPGKENNLALAWEARSRRIKQTQDARKEFLCSGPGGMAGKMTKAADNKHKVQNLIENQNRRRPFHENNEVLLPSNQEGQTSEERIFGVEKSFSSDLVTGLSAENMRERKMSKTSLFTRLRKKQGGSKGKDCEDTPDHRLSLALSDSQDTHAGNVSRQGSHSCPSSPSLNNRRRTRGWKNVFKGKTSR